MYYSYFGLQEAPFSIAVNPRYLYMSPSHRDALAHLLYGLGGGGGFILLTGEVGTGKTTINRCLTEQLPDNIDLAIVLNPALDARDLLATVCEEFGILPRGGRPGLKALTDALHRFLLKNHAGKRKTVLMIDEAQHLSFEVLEQIRLLTNLETHEEKLLHIILIGQPELTERLARPELRQLNQRITARYDLAPLSRDETAAYIRHRLHVAGLASERTLFPESLVTAIHRESQGVPRLINLLCDRMLLGAYGQSSDRPDRAMLQQAVAEVLGREPVDAGRSPMGLRIVLGVAAAIALVGFALWATLWEASTPAGVPPAAGLTVPAAQPSPATETETETEAEADAPVAAAGGKDVRDPVDSGAAEATWFLPPEVGESLLHRLYALEGTPGRATDLCLNPRPAGLECLRLAGQTWTGLLQDARPALLRLVDTRRREGRALFLGMEGDTVILGTTGGLERVGAGEVGALWTGEAWRLWKRPPPIGRSLAPGDSGDDVAAVAELFARLDGQDRTLGAGSYDRLLEERVRLFQRSTGLEADGVLGEETLRALVLAAGEDLTVSDARRLLAVPQIGSAAE